MASWGTWLVGPSQPREGRGPPCQDTWHSAEAQASPGLKGPQPDSPPAVRGPEARARASLVVPPRCPAPLHPSPKRCTVSRSLCLEGQGGVQRSPDTLRVRTPHKPVCMGHGGRALEPDKGRQDAPERAGLLPVRSAVLCGRCLLMCGARRGGRRSLPETPSTPAAASAGSSPCCPRLCLGHTPPGTTGSVRWSGASLTGCPCTGGCVSPDSDDLSPRQRREAMSLGETRILRCLRVFLREGVPARCHPGLSPASPSPLAERRHRMLTDTRWKTQSSVQLAALPDTRMPLYPHPREASVSIQALWGLTVTQSMGSVSFPLSQLGVGSSPPEQAGMAQPDHFCGRHPGTSRSIC